MLMEDRAEKTHGTENAEKSMSLDLQRVYNQKPWVSAVKKRGSGNGSSSSNALKRKLDSDDQNEARKKSKKEVFLSSLSSGKKSKKSAGGVSEGRLKPVGAASGKLESREDVRGDGDCSGLGGISLNLNSNVTIPKRPRDLVRRKKVEPDVVSKQERPSSSIGNLAEGRGKLNGTSDCTLSQNGNANGKLPQNGESEGTSNGNVVVKVKRKNNSHDHKENRSSGPDLLRHLKRDDSHSSLHDDSVTKKARRNRKKKKETRIERPVLTVEAKQESSRICDDSQDDEENLEANAARMLSSRFDPSCTGFSAGGKSSKLPSANGLSALVSSSTELATTHPHSRDESDIASSDAEARVLRPRDQQKAKGLSRKRRHFYEVVFRDLDSYWVLNRRIKIFWPLDQRWYFGHVIGYDPEKKLHHIKYDDREEELIDLQHERFKLLLLPSEVPGKVGRKRSTAHPRKGKHGETADIEEKTNSSCMESEPIISWLARSTLRKSPPVGVRKKKRTKSQSSSVSEGKIEPWDSLELGSSGRHTDNFACSSALLNNSGDTIRESRLTADNFLSSDDRAPIVYFRRRYHKKDQPPSSVLEGGLCLLSEKPPVHGNAPEFVDCIDLDVDMPLLTTECGYPAKRLCNDELIWDIDCSGLLKLITPVTSLKVSKFDLSFPMQGVSSKIVGWQRFMFMLQHGTLISTWPIVHLEILFVDNIVGLRFLLFEGCMKQAVCFVFLVLAILCLFEQKEMHDDQQFPMTSVRFRFAGLPYLEKQLVFTFYNFTEMANSKWLYLDRKLKNHCMLTKQLPPSECTYDNIEALRSGCNQLKLTNVSRKPSSVMNLQKRSRQRGTSFSSRHSGCIKLSGLAFASDDILGRFPPFALSFGAAPSFFLSLHLRLLMERSIPSSSFWDQDPVYLMDHPDNEGGLVATDKLLIKENSILSSVSVGDNSLVHPNIRSELDSCSNIDLGNNLSVDVAEAMTSKPSLGSDDSPEIEVDSMLQLDKRKAQLTESEHTLSSAQPLDVDNQHCTVGSKVKGGPRNGMITELPVQGDADTGVQNIRNSVVLALRSIGGVCTPKPTASQSTWDRSRDGISCSLASASMPTGWIDGKQDFLLSGFGNGPKKPRTQVSYSLPFGGQDCNSKNKFHHSKGFSHKRIRRASEKKTSEAFGTAQRNMELLSSEANILITAGDRGWRECGARIVLELFDHSEWRLAVKTSGDTRYSYKAHQFVQPGTTNRYTHAMMWKGGKDWILEFPDRSQWATFKEMHEECYNRNFRAASVKNIPIPGVRLIEENDDNSPEVPYIRPSPKYYRQVETDIDIAMDPSRVLYDMDSDDERWIIKHRGIEFNERGCGDVSDEMFEKTIDVLEKFAYVKQCDLFTSDELEEVTAEVGPLEAMKIIYEHWKEKRQRKGVPLVRHLQPALWEKYQQQVKEWEQMMAKSNVVTSSGFQEKSSTIEKPPMFAFCLKPRGLEIPNRGSKQRSQKKLPVGALSNGIPGDADIFHSLAGRRLNGFALGDDRAVYSAYNQGMSDSSPVLQGSTRVFSPRDPGTGGYFSLSSDGYEKNHYPKLYRNKSKKLCFIPSSSDQLPYSSYNQRTPAKRSSAQLWSSSEWPSQMRYQPDGFQRHNFDQLGPTELDEFRLRDAASAARHAVTVAKMKRENAQRMLCRADLAMHKAVAAIMTAEAVKASCREANSDVQMSE
ncbi:uncharacterized protein LOC104887746 [Beta vulgaris subsp. vulgaris]|uniref:uncharacterized protein LOC104887746 n=1 Tax=Beta vulgaris subsp. vulgaris TaxID=3555 RepID=UPI002036D8CD|nr:uncharacterized protein LOC104887746 [Beta vulgaris subsp. vulgaris]